MKLADLKEKLQQKVSSFTQNSIDDAIQHGKKELKRVLDSTTTETKDKIFFVATIGIFTLAMLDGLRRKTRSFGSVQTGTIFDSLPSGTVFNITYTENNTYNYYEKECKCGGR